MGVVGDGTVVAPFANEAMRLLREDWKGKYGAKMLAEELFPILQTGIPNPDQNFQNFITINAGEDDKFVALIDKFGNKLFEIDEFGIKPIEPPNYPPAKLKPRIVWGPKTIAVGDSIGPDELDAVAVDPETGAEVAGAYVYTPPDGTTFSTAGKETLYVNFTPTDGVKYRRAMGSTVLTILAAGIWVPLVNWNTPDDIIVGAALSGTQLNATAADPNTGDPVPGVFTYTPISGTVLSAGNAQVLSVHFVPTDTVTYAIPEDVTVLINVRTPTFNGSQSASPNGTSISGSALVNDYIVVTVGGKGSIGTVSDTAGNTYALIASSTSGGYAISMFWARHIGPSGSFTISTNGSDVTIIASMFRYLTATTIQSSTGGVTVTDPMQATVSLSLGTIPVSAVNTVTVGAWLGSQTLNKSIDVQVASGWTSGGSATVTASGKEISLVGFFKMAQSSNQTPTTSAACNASGGNAVSVGVGASFTAL